LRYINLRFLSKCLNGRRHNPPDTTLAAKKAWRRTNKKDIRKACYKQQHGLCAYTELSLDNAELGCHLEHIAPRSNYPERTFIPHNIILSIMSDIQSGALQLHEKFGGHHKSEEYADDWFISPFNRDCATFFKYHLNGLVAASTTLRASDQNKADKTIRVLNLNADYLVERRRECLRALAEQVQALGANDNLLDRETDAPMFSGVDQKVTEGLTQLATETLELRSRKLPEFYSAKKQLLENFGIIETPTNSPLPL